MNSAMKAFFVGVIIYLAIVYVNYAFKLSTTDKLKVACFTANLTTDQCDSLIEAYSE